MERPRDTLKPRPRLRQEPSEPAGTPTEAAEAASEPGSDIAAPGASPASPAATRGKSGAVSLLLKPYLPPAGNRIREGEQPVPTLELHGSSVGRFDTPAVTYWQDYSYHDVSALIGARQEEVMSNLIAVYNNARRDARYEAGNMTLPEIYELGIGMKIRFANPLIKYEWIAPCQHGLADQHQKKQERTVDLTEVKFRSLLDIEAELRAQLQMVLETSVDNFEVYLKGRYDLRRQERPATPSIADEVAAYKIREPIFIPDTDGNRYYFQQPRFKHLALAWEEACRRYALELHDANTRPAPDDPHTNKPLQGKMLASWRKEQIDVIISQRNQFALTAAASYQLLAINDREFEEQERPDIYIPRGVMERLEDKLAQFDYGVKHELENVCSLDGCTERGLLQRWTTPADFVRPGGSTPGTSASEQQLRTGAIGVFFGA